MCARIPVRTNTDDRYFGDAFQAMPADGYTALFERAARPPADRGPRSAPTRGRARRVDTGHLVWTGPIDEFFGHRFGALPYRSLRFERETRATPGGALAAARRAVNHPDERDPVHARDRVPPPHRPGPRCSTLTYEFPTADGDPYYPVPRPENRALYHRYAGARRAAAGRRCSSGRLARYQYLNMDQVVAAAMVAVDRWAADRELATLPEAA